MSSSTSNPKQPGTGSTLGDTAPRTVHEIQSWIVEKVAEELKCPTEKVDVTMPFDSLGIDSVTAFMLTGDLAQFLDRELSAELLWEFHNIHAVSEHLATLCGETVPNDSIAEPSATNITDGATVKPGEQSWRYLLPFQSAGWRTPLFCIHGHLRYVAQHIGKDQPLFGLRPHGFDLKPVPDTLEDMAGLYIREIRAAQSQGPYRVAGYSAGCVTAYEVAQQLVASGEVVDLLILLEPVGFRPGPPRTKGEHRTELNMWTRVAERLRRRAKHIIARASLKLRGRVPRFLREFHHLSASRKAMAQFAPLPYDGHVFVFRAIADDSEDDPTAGLRGVVTGQIEVVHVAGSHLDMLDAPYAPSLAGKLRDCLTASPSSSRPSGG
jgi:thioesterase domain-containing protein/acyl carrier protein